MDQVKEIPSRSVKIKYKNIDRLITPCDMVYSMSHGDPCWLLKAHDVNKNKVCLFYMSEITEWVEEK